MGAPFEDRGSATNAGVIRIGLATGDTISVEDLIHTLMLRTGNDPQQR